MGNHKAGAISALSFSDRRLGFASPDRRERSSAIWISEAVAARGEHAADRMLSVLDGLGLPAEPADFAGHLLAERPCEPVDGDKRFILLHPATGWANKDYPADRWAAVAGQIASPEVKILVAPGPGEQECARQIATLAPGAVETLDPPSLPELVFLQRRASLVIGGDTGPIHLAHALGTPVLCVMGPTDPLRNGPYDAAESVVTHPLPCSFCHKKLDGPRACLLEIDPAIVADRVLDHPCCKSH
jgi:heptosyltransferase-1